MKNIESEIKLLQFKYISFSWLLFRFLDPGGDFTISFVSIFCLNGKNRAGSGELNLPVYTGNPIVRISFNRRSFSMGFTIYEVAPPLA